MASRGVWLEGGGSKIWLDRLSSVKLTLACVMLAMALVAIGTLAQVHLGTFEAQKEYFNSWLIYTRAGNVKLPVFAGGLTIGMLWLLNLTAAFITHFFPFRKKNIGLIISHTGILLLLLGQLMTQILARESQMPILIGQSSNYSESFRETELVLIKTSGTEGMSEVTSIPDTVFLHEGVIHPPRLPFSLVIHAAYRNAQLGMAEAGTASLATQGIGTRIAIREIPPVSGDEEANNVSAFVEIRDDVKSRGIWLVSTGLGAPQSFNVQGADYQIYIRPKRIYYPFTLTLKEFHHDIYPGTDIPKNFSSLVQLSSPGKHEDREALIYMNHPLRYEGKTFYQASFGEGDKLSVFQVVENPAAATPYLSCIIVLIGLSIQFLSHLVFFAKKRS